MVFRCILFLFDLCMWVIHALILSACAAPQTLLHKPSPRFRLYPDIQTHQSLTLLHSHCCSDCLARYSKAGFKIFPPPVQICSTLKWISLLHLSSLLTGMWIILTGPVWSLFSLSPWFAVFLEQEGGVSHCGLWCKPGAWPSLAGCPVLWMKQVHRGGGQKGQILSEWHHRAQITLRFAVLWLRPPVGTLTRVDSFWDEASHVLCTGTDKCGVCIFTPDGVVEHVCEGGDSNAFRQIG